MTAVPPATDPAPPPPGGMLWDVAGDVRVLLSLPAALTLQVAHPAVGAGVDAHSVFRTDPWGRAERSVTSVLRWVYGGPEAVAEGRRLRRLHRTIRGTDAHGRPYHALDPHLYAWVHATGFPVYRHCLPYLLGRPLTRPEEDRLYREWLQVGRVLGLRDRDMPQSVAAFWPYYRGMLRELEATVVVRELTDPRVRLPALDRGPWPLRLPARALWPLLGPALVRFRRFLTLGFMPPDARQALGLPWTARQERRLRRLTGVIRAGSPLLPERMRYLPAARRARQAHRRAGG